MIEAKDLSMRYGSVVALDGVSFDVKDKEIVGLLGPNGAGKTTIMRILTTFIYPTRGTALIEGCDITENPIGARRTMGYLPETPPLYADMRVDEFMDFVGRARGLRGGRLKERKDWTVTACGIGPVWKHGIHELSLGFRQRVGLAQALIHDPKVLILDEPTSGLDPIQIIGIRALIQELAETKAILFSTHVLQEASTLSNRLLIINQGKIVAQGTPSELRAAGPRKEEVFHVTVAAPRGDVEPALLTLRSVKRAVFAGAALGGQRFECATHAYPEAAAEVVGLAASKGWPLRELAPVEASLEEVFVGFYKKSERK